MLALRQSATTSIGCYRPLPECGGLLGNCSCIHAVVARNRLTALLSKMQGIFKGLTDKPLIRHTWTLGFLFDRVKSVSGRRMVMLLSLGWNSKLTGFMLDKSYWLKSASSTNVSASSSDLRSGNFFFIMFYLFLVHVTGADRTDQNIVAMSAQGKGNKYAPALIGLPMPINRSSPLEWIGSGKTAMVWRNADSISVTPTPCFWHFSKLPWFQSNPVTFCRIIFYDGCLYVHLSSIKARIGWFPANLDEICRKRRFSAYRLLMSNVRPDPVFSIKRAATRHPAMSHK